MFRKPVEESEAALSDLMTQPAPSLELRAAILARRRTVRALLEERQDRLALDSLGEIVG